MILSDDQRGKDFSGLDLSGALFENADLYRSKFVGSNLAGARFCNCFAAEADFTRTGCRGMRAEKTNFYRAAFRGADLEQAVFQECVLAGADLRAANLRRLTLTLDCDAFEEVQLGRFAGAALAYLFGRAHSPQRQRWLEVAGEEDLSRVQRVFER
jgi:uncharacterized protein YjbI with pentapeptide repeats